MESSFNSSILCNGRVLLNGNAEYTLSSNLTTCDDFDWISKGTVVAHEEEGLPNVLNYNASSLLLQSSLPNVSLEHHCQPPITILCNGPLSTPPGGASDLMPWIYGLCVVLFLLAVGIGICYCWRKKKGCFKVNNQTPEARTQPHEQIQLNNRQEESEV